VCITILNYHRLRELIIFGQQPLYRTKLRNSVFRENELGYNGSDKDISNVISSQNACMNWHFVTECLKTNTRIILCVNISPYFTENQVRYSYSTTNKMHLLSQIIYYCKTLTYFGRSFRPSSGAQNCVYSNGICQVAAATGCYRE
jgi:hypothetical protein